MSISNRTGGSQTSLGSGLVSITFRQLAIEQIVDLVATAELDGIEWGGDLHVPPDQPEAAIRARELTIAAGLSVLSYGSYYRAGFSNPVEFNQTLATAELLQAPVIRVWAGRQGSLECTPETRLKITRDLARIARLAAARKITVACEYHGNTLNDTVDSARQLLREVGPAGVGTYWQPLHGTPKAQRTQGLLDLLPALQNLHVYYWHPETRDRRPLAENIRDWNEWLQLVAGQGPARQINCLLEFVRDDQPEQFLEDAKTLKNLLAGVS